MKVYMAVDVHDQLIRACDSPDGAEAWITRRAQTSHGSQQTVTFHDDPLIESQRYAVIGDESWLTGAYRIISQEVLSSAESEGDKPAPTAKAVKKS